MASITVGLDATDGRPHIVSGAVEAPAGAASTGGTNYCGRIWRRGHRGIKRWMARKRDDEKSWARRRSGLVIIGCGAISAYHVDALRLIPEAKIVVCCDLIRKGATKNRCRRRRPSIILRRLTAIMDLVFVLTPNYLHKESPFCSKEKKESMCLSKTVCHGHAAMP